MWWDEIKGDFLLTKYTCCRSKKEERTKSGGKEQWAPDEPVRGQGEGEVEVRGTLVKSQLK